ncbi:hypothetical protein HKX48_000450 [Thoreauomyces humboldtii]|nr:hypothetical protein HKX48_000450 [Thoreauomyces humboldtii]
MASPLTLVNSPNASRPQLGAGLPYSHAVLASGLAFLTGQIGLPADASTVVAGGIRAETLATLANIKAILTECGSSLDRVVRCEVFLIDLQGDFDGFNEAWKEVFGDHKPARAVMEIRKLGMGARIEIVCTAHVG